MISLWDVQVCGWWWWFKMRQLSGLRFLAWRFPQRKWPLMCSPQNLEQVPPTRISWQVVKACKPASTNISYNMIWQQLTWLRWTSSLNQATSTNHLDFQVLSKKHVGHLYPRWCTATGSWNATWRNLADHGGMLYFGQHVRIVLHSVSYMRAHTHIVST